MRLAVARKRQTADGQRYARNSEGLTAHREPFTGRRLPFAVRRKRRAVRRAERPRLKPSVDGNRKSARDHFRTQTRVGGARGTDDDDEELKTRKPPGEGGHMSGEAGKVRPEKLTFS